MTCSLFILYFSLCAVKDAYILHICSSKLDRNFVLPQIKSYCFTGAMCSLLISGWRICTSYMGNYILFCMFPISSSSRSAVHCICSLKYVCYLHCMEQCFQPERSLKYGSIWFLA